MLAAMARYHPTPVTLLWDSAKCSTNLTLSSGNTIATLAGSISTYATVLANVGKSSGKRCFAVKIHSPPTIPNVALGMSESTGSPPIWSATGANDMVGFYNSPGATGSPNSYSFNNFRSDLSKAVAEWSTPVNGTIVTPSINWANGDTVVVAVDLDSAYHSRSMIIYRGDGTLIYNGAYYNSSIDGSGTFFPACSLRIATSYIEILATSPYLPSGYVQWTS
jgi:hypothetical protein